MGADKAFLRFGEHTLLERAIKTAKRACDTVALVGDKERLRPYGWVIEDTFPGHGPLSGIHAALTSVAVRDLNLFLAVDTPSIPPEFLRFLLTTAVDSGAIVTVPRVNEHVQPLCAVYRPPFAPVAEQALVEGRNKIEPLFAEVHTRIVEEAEIKALGFPPTIFDNVNTPEDWQRMQRKLGASHG